MLFSLLDSLLSNQKELVSRLSQGATTSENSNDVDQKKYFIKQLLVSL